MPIENIDFNKVFDLGVSASVYAFSFLLLWNMINSTSKQLKDTIQDLLENHADERREWRKALELSTDKLESAIQHLAGALERNTYEDTRKNKPSGLKKL